MATRDPLKVDPMPYTQENRFISIETPLGKDALLLMAFKGSEGISTPFKFELSMLSENHAISFESIVGKNATITVQLPNGEQRYFNGIISRFAQGRGGGQAGGDPRFSYYTATLVPWLWLLTRSAESRIFQEQSTPDIVMKVLKEKGITEVKRSLHKDYQPRTYCVQYRETHFNFISRLLEEEGIFYFFQHEEGKHIMILADDPVEHKPCPNQERARYQLTRGGWLEEDVITSLEKSQEIRAGKYSLNDYNFETPNTDLQVNVDSRKPLGPQTREVYDYPGIYTKIADGEKLSTTHMEEEEAQITSLIGSSHCRAFTSGYRFQLTHHYRADTSDKDYLLTYIEHEASVPSYTGSTPKSSEHEPTYINYFKCIPHSVVFRPVRNAAKPVISGTQTAFVVGPKGEEIYTDQHGRIKVQFHWDRDGKMDEKSSCWMRVGQLWAAAKWGAMFIPRIGQEVIVDFLEGDPDRPIVIGCVYHGANKPPYDLPDHQTMSTIKSWSSKDGQGFNELRFEDKKGEEQIFIHAEKNEDIRIKNDLLEWVGRDSHLIVKRDQIESIEGGKHLAIKGDHNEKTTGSISVQAGMNRQEKAGIKYAMDAGMEIHLKAGMNMVLEVPAGTITLKAGAAFIVVGPTGVTISGIPVLINSGGAAGAGSGSSPETPKDPKEADKADPGEKTKLPPRTKEAKRDEAPLPPGATAQKNLMKQAAKSGTPFCDICP